MEAPVVCLLCDREFANQKGLKMHCSRSHGERCEARIYVVGPVCPSYNGNCVARQQVIGHLMCGALACMLPWRLDALPAFPPEVVAESDLADRAGRRVARRVGVISGTGIPCLRGVGVMALLRKRCL